MGANYRNFEAGPDPFGDTWEVEFLWLQNAISIRHADTVDVKFLLRGADREVEKVVALPHPALLELARREGRPLTDPWCMKLAAEHLRHLIITGEDIEKTLVTVSPPQLAHCAARLDETVAAR